NRHDTNFPHEPHRAVGPARPHQTEDLLEQAGARGAGELESACDHRVVDVGIDPEIEPGCELDRAEDANGILAEANVRLPDGADGAALNVRHASTPIEHLPTIEIVEERIDREVTTEGILVRLAEDVVAPNQKVIVAIGLAGVASKRRHFDDFAATEEDM